MIKQATGNCFWRYDEADEYRIYFVGRCDDGSEELFYTIRTFELEKFLSAAVVIGEQQHLWGDWRALAEQGEHEALDRIIASLGPAAYLESVVDVAAVKHPSQKNAVILSVHLAPTRRVRLIKHTFGSAQLQTGFLQWWDRVDPGKHLGLCLIGLLEGKNVMAEKMNAIADAQLAFGRKLMEVVIEAIEEGRDEAFIPAQWGPD
ncbi:muconolactone delta-isomerase [Porphyrobacter sp. MBR-155]|jgi:muconolactone delta-isomerase|uniref:hypothetical protein n=1 Tax=Porphyrobacter sp. MBR-155 TaxID=3156464 RepID=UPI0033999430